MDCCTWDCAYMNECRPGGVECARCGGAFCASEIGEDGLCELCAAEAELEEDEEARGTEAAQVWKEDR